MRFPIISVGDFVFEDEPINKGLIGGKVIATNLETGETTSRNYKKLHTGKTTKFDVVAQMMQELIPPPKNDEDKAEDMVEI